MPLFTISREEVNYVNCNSGLPSLDMGLYMSEHPELSLPEPSTYREITLLSMTVCVQQSLSPHCVSETMTF